MLKTLFDYPPFHRLHGIRNRFFPIGLGYLAGILKAAGQETAIYNAENFDDQEELIDEHTYTDMFKTFDAYQSADDPNHYVWKEVESVIREQRPDIIGITTKSCMIPSAQIVSKIAKRVNPNCVVVWGGPHASNRA